MEHSVDAILLCPPNIDDDSLRQLSDKGSGYTYLLSRAGVTGTNVAAGMPVQDLLAKINDFNAPPALLGFGISTPKHVVEAIQSGARGVIVGSAIVQIIQSNLGNMQRLSGELSDYIKKMKAATANS